MKKKTNKPINMIEIDENTAEPKIVRISEEEYLNSQEKDVEIPEADFIKRNSGKGAGKQIAMERIIGIQSNADKEISKRQKIFKKVFVAVFVIFVLAILAWTFYQDFFKNDEPFPSIQDLAEIFSKCWQYLIYALFSLFLCYFFKGLKLSVMCKYTSGKFHFRTCLETGVIGHYYNCVTPLAVGGQPFEIYHLSKHGVKGGVAAALPIAAFFLNQMAFVILGIISLILFQNNTLEIPDTMLGAFSSVSNILAIIGLVLCFLAPFLVVLFSMMPRIGAKLVGFVMAVGGKLRIIKNPKEKTYKTVKNVIHNSQCLKKIATNPLVFLLSFLLSVCEWLSLMSIAYFSLKFFGFDFQTIGGFREWLQVVQLCLILSASVSFIPTPGNAGAADLSFFLLFESGLKSGLAFPSMTVWRLLSFYSFIIIGFIFATVMKNRERKATLSSDVPE